MNYFTKDFAENSVKGIGKMFDFKKCFERLSGNAPFDWQERLFQSFVDGLLPDACDIPTGMGKTSVMTVWLIALGCLLKEKSVKIPRRLVYVVDRRVIVDQASEEAKKILNVLSRALLDSSDSLHELAQTFRDASMKGSESLIALSTLRGQKADNREWCLDPSRPAIIIGTVDMIGSRLLFSGYGKVGINHRSLQAGLLGQDTLIVVDEAHLSPPFVSTLDNVYHSILRFPVLRPFHVMTLSATLSGQAKTISIDANQESKNETARLRLNASKRIEWLPFDQRAVAKAPGKSATGKEINEALAETLVNRAIQYEQGNANEPLSIVIFVRTVDLVNLITNKLVDKLEAIAALSITDNTTDKSEKADIKQAIESRILKMTGEMRGAERDVLVKTEPFKHFLNDRDRRTPRPPFYMVATSCAEVGVNLDADHCVCDLSTLDSMIQRIGRVNRFGKTESRISVLVDESVAAKTGEALSKLEEVRKKLAGDKSGGVLKAFRKIKADFDQEVKSKRLLSDKLYYTWRALNSMTAADGSIDASPLALRGLLKDNLKALPDAPVIPPFDQSNVDDWAMTSLKQSDFPRPLVQYWLRGVIDDESAQTTFVWRTDLGRFENSEDLTRDDWVQLATAIPIQPGERANLLTSRGELLVKLLSSRSQDALIVITDPGGESKTYTLLEIKDKKNLFQLLAYSTVILPCEVGGLDKYGNPVDRLPKEGRRVPDVVGNEWTRYLITRHSPESFSISPFEQQSHALVDETRFPSWQKAVASITDSGVCKNARAIQNVFIDEPPDGMIGEEEGAKSYIAYFFNHKIDKDKRSSLEADYYLREDDDDIASVDYPRELKPRTVTEHNLDVSDYADRLATKIGLSGLLIKTLATAGRLHDLGKAREWWQKAIGNDMYKPSSLSVEENRPLAKSNKSDYFDHSINQGYRHEFGSLVECLEDSDLSADPNRDLSLHLIAAHHGYARPHFPERAFDHNLVRALNQQIAHEAMLRFNRLQRQYGWWQLAYLEAILKAADAMASRDFSRGELQ